MKKRQSRLLKSDAGFTLIELLVVVVVLMTVSAIVANIITTSFRGSNKVTTITNVKQNGNYAISLMSKTLRNAARIDELGGTAFNGCTFTPAPTPNPTPTPVAHSSIGISLLDGTKTTFSCCMTDPSTIAQAVASPCTTSGSSLLDTNTVAVTSCSFYCTQLSPIDPPKINIKFILTQRGASTLAPEQRATVPFETSVILRNAVK